MRRSKSSSRCRRSSTNRRLHCQRLPRLINVGHRELLLRPEHVKKYYQHAYSAAELAVHSEKTLAAIGAACETETRVFVDLDCDAFDPAYFPAVAEPTPFGLSPQLLLRILEVIGIHRLAGIALSEFHPAHDVADRGLETLMWLLEYVLLGVYEVR
ncbi:MAG: arginase family protein [Acidobacteriales bacterium]|nr:arginase family protein [Terriglobales bacterium]